MGVSSGDSKGFRDWKLQRLSAVVMLFYVCFLFAFFVGHTDLTYLRWHQLFASVWMQVSTMAVVFLMLVHAWIGIWTIGTDYIKCHVIRTIYDFCVFSALVAYFFWILKIIWSV